MARFTRICFYCKREFEATLALANICSPECRKTAYTSRTFKSPPEPSRPTIKAEDSSVKLTEGTRELAGIDAMCYRCGKAIEVLTSERKYCSRACRKAMQRQGRRAKIRHAYVEPVSMVVLRQRDQNTCRICGEPVDSTKHPPDPAAATIDHVIALARGGEHSYRNTQLAHLRCNIEKGEG